MKKKYEIICHNERESFDKIITTYLNRGWELVGSLNMTIAPSGTAYFSQAVIKETEN